MSYKIYNEKPAHKGVDTSTRDGQPYIGGMRLYVVLDGLDEVVIESTAERTMAAGNYYADPKLAFHDAMTLMAAKAGRLKESLLALEEWKREHC